MQTADERGIFADAADDLPLPQPGRGDFPRRGRDDLPAIIDDTASSVPRPPARQRPHAAAWLADVIERERLRGSYFNMVPVLLGIGALIYFQLPFEPAGWRIGAGCIALGLLIVAGRRNPWLRVGGAAGLLLLAGLSAAALETWRANTPVLGSEISTRLTGRIAAIEQQASGRVRLTLDVLATERPTLRYAPRQVRATARSVPEAMRVGDVVTGAVRLFPPSGPVRPHGYDFAFKNYFSGIGAGGFFLSGPDAVAVENRSTYPEPGAMASAMTDLANWRDGLAARIAKRIGGAEGQIAAALITGVRAGIPDAVNDALRVTGLYHIISISGLHMALVGGTVLLGMRAAFAMAPGFAMRHPVKKYAAGVALAAAGFYLVLSGAEVAAQRSFIMLAVMLIAVMFDRAALTMRNLAISACIIILISPHEVAGPSFQMSFAATAALIAAYAQWSSRKERRGPAASASGGFLAGMTRKSLGYVAALAMTSIVAGAATALFSAWHFQQVSPLGLAANLAVMPIVSVVVMPMAVLAVLLMPLGLDGLPLDMMGHGIAAMNAIALWLADRSFYNATGALPLSGVLAISAALALATMLTGALRWMAAPLLVFGVVALWRYDLPDVLVSEDARLVAMRLADGRIAINRARANAFTMENWERVMGGGKVAPPVGAGGAGGQRDVTMPATEGFRCAEGLCTARHGSGAIVAVAADAATAARACATATLIIVDDATATDVCLVPAQQRDGTEPVPGRPQVITKRDLARRGSAEIRFVHGSGGLATPAAANDGTTRVDIIHAIAEPYRVWHEHRRYSREARGMAPYRRTERPRQSATDTSAPSARADNDPAAVAIHADDAATVAGTDSRSLASDATDTDRSSQTPIAGHGD